MITQLGSLRAVKGLSSGAEKATDPSLFEWTHFTISLHHLL